MKSRKFLLAFLLSLVALGLSVNTNAQTVRGQLIRATPYGPYPAPYVAVTLYSDRIGRSAPAYTSPDGFYFLYNVPPGQYVLEIWTSNIPVTSRVIVAPQPLTDIAPVTVR